MRFLFVHQGFPGQYRHVVRALAAQGHHIVALVRELTEAIPDGVLIFAMGCLEAQEVTFTLGC